MAPRRCRELPGWREHRSGSGLDLQPSDYFWATSRIVAVANVCCDGRVVSVLEGGYGKRQKHELDRSDMSKCAAAHVAALVGGSNGDILYDSDNSCEEDLLPSSSKSDFAAEPDDHTLIHQVIGTELVSQDFTQAAIH